MELLIRLQSDSNTPNEWLKDVVDVGRRHPEDCILILRHEKIGIESIEVLQDMRE